MCALVKFLRLQTVQAEAELLPNPSPAPHHGSYTIVHVYTVIRCFPHWTPTEADKSSGNLFLIL